MIIDNHVHVGWFTDGYHSPRSVWNSLMAAGVDGMVISSTSTCAELYKVVIREMRELIRLGGERIHPILWISPKMIKRHYALPLMLHSGIKWRGVKLHFEAHPEWTSNKYLLKQAIEVARQLNVSVLLHTGNKAVSHAGRFAPLIEANNNLMFILAHGRPHDETIAMLKTHDNLLVDTAFMSNVELSKLIEQGLQQRIIFGTDAPINRVYYPGMSTEMFIRKQIEMVRETCGNYAASILARTPYN